MGNANSNEQQPTGKTGPGKEITTFGHGPEILLELHKPADLLNVCAMLENSGSPVTAVSPDGNHETLLWVTDTPAVRHAVSNNVALVSRPYQGKGNYVVEKETTYVGMKTICQDLRDKYGLKPTACSPPTLLEANKRVYYNS
jgi:hypothetical protein